MNEVKTYFKQKPIRLKGKKLQELKQACIERDKVCLYSGSPYNLQAHHVVFLSRGGSDTIENLATVTAEVHDMIHKEVLRVTGEYPDLKWEVIK